MAVTITLYNTAVSKFVDGSHSASDAYKVELLNNSATFTASDTTKAAVDGSGSYEVSGNGWDVGGEATTLSVSLTTTNDATIDATDISVTATGGPIGPAYKALLYNDTDSDHPVAFIDFGEAKTADEGTDFKITWNAAGVVSFTYT